MYLKHGHFERLQNIKVEICGMETKTKKQKKKQNKKSVKKSSSCSWSFLQYCMDSKIRIWLGLILLKESVGIKCAMYDQHVEY